MDDTIGLTLVVESRDQPSFQSSTYETPRMPCPGPRAPSFGNDGCTNGYQEWRCCRTTKEADPWWEVDLGNTCAISTIHIWKGLTYHEHPKNPHGRPPATSTASTSSPSPPLWVLISKEPFGRSAGCLELAKKQGFAQALTLSNDKRVETLHIATTEANAEGAKVIGRYVRLQQESARSVLQFAEIEIMGERVGDDIEPRDVSTDTLLKQDDGFYGIDSALHGDIQEHVESGWLNPSVNNTEIRLWIGSFDEKQPAIQWLNGKTSRDAVYAVELTFQHLSSSDVERPAKKLRSGSPVSPMWKSLDVDARSNILLDRDSTEILRLLSAKKEQKSSHVEFLNNNMDSNINGRSPTAPSDAWFHKLACSTLVRAKKLDLGARIETKTYAKGEVILSYGEHKRAVFFIQKGNVDLLGPASSIGTNTIGSIVKGSYFNEMALFGVWSAKPATFQAADTVICEVLSYAALVESLGEEKIKHIRSEIIRKRHAAAISPPNPASSGNKSLRRLHRKGSSSGRAEDTQIVHVSDSTHAQTFAVKIPSSALSSATEALSYRLVLNIFDCHLDEKTTSYSKRQRLGYANVLPSQLQAHGEGSCTLPILSSNESDKFNVAGQIAISYLLVKPFVHPANNLALSWRSYWRERPPLNIGHRGMGRSYHQVDGFRHALTRENTLASFILAERSGADFVEFDVQLTKDRVPVLYHDFVVNVGLEDKRAWTFGTKAEEYQIGIHEMSLRQLRHCQSAPVPRNKTGTALSRLVKKHRLQLLAKNGSVGIAPSLSENAEEDDEEHLVDFYPQLEELLKHVPAEVGLNVEIKYPEPLGNRFDMRKLPAFAMNGYVDAILKCVFEHAGNRRIFFSCFDPNVCVMLRTKQIRYPVFFLTYGAIQPKPFDARLSLQFAANFVKMERLHGIVSNCPAFLAEPGLVQVVKDQIQRPLLTWGDQNTNHESVQLQKRHAIDGVISDNIGDLIRQDKKLAER